MKYLITGGCGFLGSNIAAELIKQAEDVVIIDNLFRQGSEKNKEWLESQGKHSFYQTDVRDSEALDKIIKEELPDTIFHLAGQVAMTTSIKNPRLDFEINALGSLNILEAVRRYSPETGIIYSSTNKVYGDLEYLNYEETATRYICKDYPEGFDENLKLDFHSPYGCSKGAADQYFLDYARIYGLKTVVFRHSSIYGGRQFSTYDQGWVGWFCQKAIEQKNKNNIEPFTISGNGKQVRDLLFVSDAVNAYLSAAQAIDKVKGLAMNIGGGINNSCSLLELFSILEEELELILKYERIEARQSDQKVFIADTSNISKLIDWWPKVERQLGVQKILQWTGEVLVVNR